MSDNNTKIFAKIKLFVKDLAQVYNEPEIVRFAKLVDETSITNKNAITRHIENFKKWFSINGDFVVNDKLKECSSDSIFVSDRCFLPIKKIAQQADGENLKAIQKHLLYIYYLINPQQQLLEKLTHSENKEEEFVESFIGNTMSKLQNKKFNNPFEIIGEMMNSGIFNDLERQLESQEENGTLDISKLHSAIQGMSSKMGVPQEVFGSMMENATKGLEDPNAAADPMSFMAGMMGNLGGDGGDLMDMVGGMMGGFGGLGGKKTPALTEDGEEVVNLKEEMRKLQLSRK